MLQGATNKAIIANIILLIYHAALLAFVFIYAPQSTWWILVLTVCAMVMYPLMQIIHFSDPDKLCFVKPYIYGSNPVLSTFACAFAEIQTAYTGAASIIASICLYIYYN